MTKFDFLTQEQIFGDDQLDIFKKHGTKCSATDFAILLGCQIYDKTENRNSKKKYTSSWWTKTPFFNDTRIVDDCGYNFWSYTCERNVGARPAISYSSIEKYTTNISIKETIEVEYGEYPQDIVPKKISNELENAYTNKALKETGKTYTTDSNIYQDTVSPFCAKSHIEYEYNGKKYIRFIGDSNCFGKILSDGTFVEKNKPYWIKVQPIIWLVDEKADIMLSKKIIFSGVQFQRYRDYEKGNFDETDIYKFMEKYFIKEIIPNNTKGNENLKKANPYKFNFNEVSEEDIIKGAVESNIAVFLHGPSSEGKSARVKQIDPNCIIIYLRNATPESLNGKSVYNQETGEMIDIKPTWLKKLEEKCEKEPNNLHIVFFDEITNALPSIQGIAFNIVLEKEVNGIWKLPENARIVAAGNDMKDSLAANKLAEPLFNRFAHVYIKTTTESWLKWASENNIHPAIYTYIAYKKGETLRSKYDGEKPNADPRKWEMASKMLYKTGKPEMLRALIGEDITREFCQFCKQRVITLKDVLNENYTEIEIQSLNTSEKYATTMGLSQVNEENFEKVREFVKKLGPEFVALYDALWVHGDENRLEIISEIRNINQKGAINGKNYILRR